MTVKTAHRPASSETAALVRRNWERLQAEVAEACERCGRSPAEVKIVGVSKYVDAPLCRQLVEAGCPVLGENRPQALWEKHSWFEAQRHPQPQWHLIGHLQRNKVRRTLPLIACLQSLDSQRLLTEVGSEATAQGVKLPVLLEVNITRDTSKTGVALDDVVTCVERSLSLTGIELRGLMAMASLEGDRNSARREFALVRKLRDQLIEQFPGLSLPELSMGMSGDYEEAIAEGATLVRIGSALWNGIMHGN